MAANISDERDSKFINSDSFHMAAVFGKEDQSYRLLRSIKEIGRTLTTSAIPLENSRGGRVSRKAASMKMYSGCQKAPMRFFPCGVSIAVFPPTLESTIANKVVGICTKRSPRMLEATFSMRLPLEEKYRTK